MLSKNCMFTLIVWTLVSQLVRQLDSQSAKKSLANFQSEPSSKGLSWTKKFEGLSEDTQNLNGLQKSESGPISLQWTGQYVHK